MRILISSAIACLVVSCGAATAAATPSIGAFSTPFSLPAAAPPTPNGISQQQLTPAPNGDMIAAWVSNSGWIPAPAQVRVRRGGTWSSVLTLNPGMRTAFVSLPERTAASGDAVVTWSDVDYSTTPITSYIYACAYSAASGAWCASPA